MYDTATPGYEDFLTTYEKLEHLRKGKNVDTKLFMTYVARCHQYIQTLDPYELQCVTNAIPDIDEKIDVIKDLYAKIRTAIHETLGQLTKN